MKEINEHFCRLIQMVEDNIFNADDNATDSLLYFIRMISNHWRNNPNPFYSANYEQAMTKVKAVYKKLEEVDISDCNPEKLKAILDYAVFLYDVEKNTQKACAIAEKAVKTVMEKVDVLDEETFRDVKSTVEMLKENLTLW